MFINRSAHFGLSPLTIMKVSKLVNTFLWHVFFIYASKIKSLTLLCFSYTLIPNSGFFLLVPQILHLFINIFFILGYLMQHLEGLKNSQFNNDYNVITISTNHVSWCHKNIILLFHYSLDCP